MLDRIKESSLSLALSSTFTNQRCWRSIFFIHLSCDSQNQICHIINTINIMYVTQLFAARLKQCSGMLLFKKQKENFTSSMYTSVESIVVLQCHTTCSCTSESSITLGTSAFYTFLKSTSNHTFVSVLMFLGLKFTKESEIEIRNCWFNINLPVWIFNPLTYYFFLLT